MQTAFPGNGIFPGGHIFKAEALGSNFYNLRGTGSQVLLLHLQEEDTGIHGPEVLGTKILVPLFYHALNLCKNLFKILMKELIQVSFPL